MELDYDSWEIDHKIGSGSYGTVYEIVKKGEFGKEYHAALKIIRIPQKEEEIEQAFINGMDEESAQEYFDSMAQAICKEIELMYSLNGVTNIINYQDHRVNRLEDGIGWEILIRMELLTSLPKYLKANKNFHRQDVIHLGIDICKALERCQKMNIIHRDIKPDNILLSEQGDFKLADFGIARTADKTLSEMSTKGTFNYMAPEVYLGKSYGYSVDIYSLGMVMYRLLNNMRVPFMPPYPKKIRYEDQQRAVSLRMSGEKIPLPANDNTRLAEIILKACSYDPKERYGNPANMRADLEALLLDSTIEKALAGDVLLPVEFSSSRSNRSKSGQLSDSKENLSNELKKEFSLGSQKVVEKGLEIPELSENEDETVSLMFCSSSEESRIPVVSEVQEKSNAEQNPENLFVSKSVFLDTDKKRKPVVLIACGVVAVVLAVLILIFAQGTDEKQNVIVPPTEIKQQTSEAPEIKETNSVAETPLTEESISTIIVKDYRNKKYKEIAEELRTEGIVVALKKTPSSKVKKGYIIKQSVSPDTEIIEGDKIVLTVSTGPKMVRVPNLIGLTQNQALKKLEKANLRLGHIEEEYDDATEKGHVIWQDEEVNSELEENDYVSFCISLGKKPSSNDTSTGGTKNGGETKKNKGSTESKNSRETKSSNEDGGSEWNPDGEDGDGGSEWNPSGEVEDGGSEWNSD